jgi:hypothetical protein
LLGIGNKYSVLQVITPLTCQSRDHFEEFCSQKAKEQAEGVIVRNPKAWYFKKDSFFKKKASYNYT